MYGGVKYLNELFYELPDTHCTKPIAIAKGVKAKNAQACGTNYQKGLLTSKKKTIQKAAEKSYCEKTPSSPQERYFECRYSSTACVSTAIAQASGQTAIVSGIVLAITLFIAVNLLGVPKSMKAKPGDINVGASGGGLGSIFMKLKGCFQSANAKLKKKKEADEEKARAKREGEGEGGDIELSEKVKVIKPPEVVTLESLQTELMETRAAQAMQEAEVNDLRLKLDKLLGMTTTVTPPSTTGKFTPASTPSVRERIAKNKLENEGLLNQGSAW
jgi:hypothetical protein